MNKKILMEKGCKIFLKEQCYNTRFVYLWKTQTGKQTFHQYAVRQGSLTCKHMYIYMIQSQQQYKAGRLIINRIKKTEAINFSWKTNIYWKLYTYLSK